MIRELRDESSVSISAGDPTAWLPLLGKRPSLTIAYVRDWCGSRSLVVYDDTLERVELTGDRLAAHILAHVFPHWDGS